MGTHLNYRELLKWECNGGGVVKMLKTGPVKHSVLEWTKTKLFPFT